MDGSEKSAVAVGLSGDQTDIVVPGSVIFNGNEYAVVRVKGDIFQNSKVTSVTFSEDFNGEIDDENSPFFENCSELVSVVWPRNLDSVPWCCFKNCQKLKSVSWSNTIRTIGSQAFQDCTSLESISLPDSLKTIEWDTFSGCTGLKEVNLPASLESLEAYTFSGCSSLAQITLPQGVKTVYGDAFKATAIRNLSIPNSVLTLTTIYGDSLRTLRLEDGTDSLHVEGNSWIVDTDSLENLYYGRNLAEYKLHHSWKFKTLEIGKYIEDLVSQILFSADTIGKIYVYRNIPPVCQMTTSVYNPWLDIYVDRVLSALNLTDKEPTTLYVPQGSLDAYAHAEVWKDFIDVQEFVPSGISSVMTTEGETVIAHYDLSGCRIPSDKKGLHIVKYTNGTSKKVVIP